MSSISIILGSKSFCLNITKLNREIMIAKLDTTSETRTMVCLCRISASGLCMKNKKYKWMVSYGKSWKKKV